MHLAAGSSIIHLIRSMSSSVLENILTFSLSSNRQTVKFVLLYLYICSLHSHLFNLFSLLKESLNLSNLASSKCRSVQLGAAGEETAARDWSDFWIVRIRSLRATTNSTAECRSSFAIILLRRTCLARI